MKQEKRLSARHQIHARAIIHSTDGRFSASAIVVDISSSGIRLGISRNNRQNLGLQVFIEIQGEIPIFLKAQLIQIGSIMHEKQAGFVFLGISKSNKNKISELIGRDLSNTYEVIDLVA